MKSDMFHAAQYMDRAVREKRIVEVLVCDVALLLLILMGLVGCLLFWLGESPLKCFVEMSLHLTHRVAGTYSLIDWEIPPDTGCP
jgi:hypothetical protein